MSLLTFREERCKGCGLCVKFCPKHCLTLAAHFNVLGFHPAALTDQELCTGCAVCAWMCPDVVIEVARNPHKLVRSEGGEPVA